MIVGFNNTYRFLSNFYPVKVSYKGVLYDNAESAYQAQKCKKAEDKYKFVGITGAEAKRLGKNIEIIDGWDNVKHQIMFEVVLQKFLQNQLISERLIDTKTEMLIETNYWHDNYWGDCKCENCSGVHGANNLGFILMHVRYILVTLHPKYESMEHLLIPADRRKKCPHATPFSHPRCMSFDSTTMTCDGIMKCKNNPYSN